MEIGSDEVKVTDDVQHCAEGVTSVVCSLVYFLYCLWECIDFLDMSWPVTYVAYFTTKISIRCLQWILRHYPHLCYHWESLLANFPLLMRFPIWVSSSSCAANLQASFKVGRVIFLAPQMPTQVWFHQELSWNSYWWCQRICIWNDPEYTDWQEWHVR